MTDMTRDSRDRMQSLVALAREAAEETAGEIVALKGVRFSAETREIMGNKLTLLWLAGMHHGQGMVFEAAKQLMTRPLAEP
jgi:quinolinate synthase